MKRWTVLMIACVSLLFIVPSIAEENEGKPDLETLRKERNEKLARYHVRELTQKRLTKEAREDEVHTLESV
ncbi:MAG: hypothetical protein JRG94_04640 [Deltaproteobacteria bacterium]|nr:hypothetical protein [Deltaproteobacteria bacterium]